MKQTQLDFLQDQVRAKSTLEHFEDDARGSSTRGRPRRGSASPRRRRKGKSLAAEKEVRAAACRELEERGAALDRERSGLVDSMQEQEKRIFERERLLAEKRAELAHLKSKHELLRRMKENFEGFPGGARHLLTSGDGRVRGPLVEFLKVEDRYRPACEAVLAGMLDGVVVDASRARSISCSELAEKKPGTRAPLRRGRAAGGAGRRGRGRSRLPRRRSARSSRSTIRGGRSSRICSAACTFSRTPTRRSISSRRSEGGTRRAVTLSGIAFSGTAGVYFAGGATEEFSLLGRSDDLERIGETIPDLDREVAGLTVACEDERAARESLQARVRELEGEIQRVREELSTRKDELQSVEKDHAMRREKVSLLLKTLDEIETSRFDVLSKLEEMKLSLRMQEESGEARPSGGDRNGARRAPETQGGDRGLAHREEDRARIPQGARSTRTGRS